MSSIAIFPCTFTSAADIASELSKTLELEMYDDERLFADTTKEFGINAEKLKHYMYDRTSVFNQFTLDKEKTINMFKSVLADRLETSKPYLFHGFLTSLIPVRVIHVLKVLIVDNKQARIACAMDSGLSKREAERMIKSNDVSAYSWTDFLLKKEAYDSSLYDMVIPVDNRTNNELIEVIVKGFHTTSVLDTAESRQAVQDLKLETAVERRMLESGHKITVRANGGDLTLVVEKSVLNYNKLVQEFTNLAKDIEGVKNVVVEKSGNYNESIYRRQKFELPSKVLFVDDEKEFVQTVSQRLISRDVGTYGVFNGEDALELVAEDRPEVMVLDLKMPGLHGIEVLRQTKKLAPEVEVIILTGHGTNQDMLECMELGAFAYLNKPVDIEELSATIKAANDRVRSRNDQ